MVKRLLLIVLGTIIVLFLAGAGALYWFLSGDGIRRALEAQASAWLGQPVQIGAATAQFIPRIGIELQNVRAGNPARVTLQSVSVTAPLRPLLNRRIEDAEITLSGSRIELPLPFALPTGDDRAPGADRATSGGGVQLVSVRAITLRDIRVSSRGREVTVNADSSLSGTRLNVQRFIASSGKTTLEASGEVELEPRVDARIAVKANQLDIDEVLGLATAFTPTSQTPARVDGSAPSTTRIVARISAEKARTGDLEVHQLAADFEGIGDRVSLSPLTFQIFGGRYQGSLAATIGRTVTASFKSRITDLDVAQLAAYGGVSDTITGRLSGAGSFNGQGADVETALANARGSGTASLLNGTIRRLDLVRMVVLFFGRPAPDSASGSDKYDRMDLQFSLADRVFRADAFAFKSPDFDIVGSGTLGVASKTIDGNLTISLSEALSAQAGTDLVRYTREENRVVLPARLGGTLDGPRVTIDAKAALTRGLRNETQRRLKSILDGLGK